MGMFYVGCKIENHADRTKSARIPKLPVDAGSEYTWVPAISLEKIRVARDSERLLAAL